MKIRISSALYLSAPNIQLQDSIKLNNTNTLRGGSIYWCLGGFLFALDAVWTEVHPGHQLSTSPLPAVGRLTAVGDSPGKWS